MHRSSFHLYFKPNLLKASLYQQFMAEAKRYHDAVFNEIWENGYEDFNTKENKLKIPKFIYQTDFKHTETNLNGSAKDQIVAQIAGELKSATKIRSKLLFWKSKETDPDKLAYIERRLAKETIKKPTSDVFELNINICNVQFGDISFLQLGAMGEYGIKIRPGKGPWAHLLRLPFKLDKRTKHRFLDNGWTLCSSIKLTTDGVYLNWEKERPTNTSSLVVACDQGINNVLTLARSDGKIFQSSNVDVHGHSLNSINAALKLKKKESKGHRRKQEHRRNFINAQINLAKEFVGEAGEFRLEDLRKLSGPVKFIHGQIRRKLEMLTEEQGLSFRLQSNAYRSQRCSSCGWTHANNRKKRGKLFKCLKCGFESDSDINAALNHLADLPSLSHGAINSRTSGAYWLRSGVCNPRCQEI